MNEYRVSKSSPGLYPGIKSSSEQEKVTKSTDIAPAATAPQSRQDEIASQLNRSSARLREAYSTISQIGEVLTSLADQSKQVSSPIASKERERLLRSAISAIEDLVDHAKVGDENPFRQGPSQQDIPQGIHGARAQALRAYSDNSQRFIDLISPDPPLTRAALSFARNQLLGKDGILASLKQGLDQGLAEEDINQLVSRTDSVLAGLQDADIREIRTIRSQLAEASATDPFSQSA